jgi:fermentation-respiration switch protein FrsA (DUF1100 family)
MLRKMRFPSFVATLLFLALTTSVIAQRADPTAGAKSPEAPVADPWDRAFFDYKKSPLIVEETTPTAAQVNWRGRPPQLPANLPAPKLSANPAKRWRNGSLDVVRLRFRDLDDADVPALLVTPAGKKGPFPVAIALHGLNSNKMQVVAQVGPALIKQGFAVLAPDMPMHGERPGEPRGFFKRGQFQPADLRTLVARSRQAILDVRLCIDLAEARPELDTKNGVVLVGYSMGAIIDSIAGPVDDRVKAMCLMVGGTVELPEIFNMVPQLAALTPQLALPHFSGRPLLMLNARQDHIISEEMAERLFAAAPEPKKQVWYDSGHLLPESAYEEAAKWVATTWKTVAANAH